MSDWTTTTPTVATDVDLLTMVRAARMEGLPALTAVTLEWNGRLCLHVHQESADDMAAWRGWWIRHGAVGWADSARHVDGGSVHHHTTGRWRGHVVDIVHVDLSGVPA